MGCWPVPLFLDNPSDPGALDEAIENHGEGFLILVGELIDFLVEPVQLVVVNEAVAA